MEKRFSGLEQPGHTEKKEAPRVLSGRLFRKLKYVPLLAQLLTAGSALAGPFDEVPEGEAPEVRSRPSDIRSKAQRLELMRGAAELKSRIDESLKQPRASLAWYGSYESSFDERWGEDLPSEEKREMMRDELFGNGRLSDPLGHAAGLQELGVTVRGLSASVPAEDAEKREAAAEYLRLIEEEQAFTRSGDPYKPGYLERLVLDNPGLLSVDLQAEAQERLGHPMPAEKLKAREAIRAATYGTVLDAAGDVPEARAALLEAVEAAQTELEELAQDPDPRFRSEPAVQALDRDAARGVVSEGTTRGVAWLLSPERYDFHGELIDVLESASETGINVRAWLVEYGKREREQAAADAGAGTHAERARELAALLDAYDMEVIPAFARRQEMEFQKLFASESEEDRAALDAKAGVFVGRLRKAPGVEPPDDLSGLPAVEWLSGHLPLYETLSESETVAFYKFQMSDLSPAERSELSGWFDANLFATGSLRQDPIELVTAPVREESGRWLASALGGPAEPKNAAETAALLERLTDFCAAAEADIRFIRRVTFIEQNPELASVLEARWKDVRRLRLTHDMILGRHPDKSPSKYIKPELDDPKTWALLLPFMSLKAPAFDDAGRVTNPGGVFLKWEYSAGRLKPNPEALRLEEVEEGLSEARATYDDQLPVLFGVWADALAKAHDDLAADGAAVK